MTTERVRTADTSIHETYLIPFVDPRNHDDARAMVKQALRLMRMFAKHGYRRDRIIVSVKPSYLRSADQTFP